MAYDPRADILGLFTNEKVSATGKYKTEYVEVHIRDRNPTLRRNYKTSRGVISLEPPIQTRPEGTIGGDVYKQPVIINCHLFIPIDEKTNYNIDTFVNAIVHSFQDTIIDNQLSTVTNGVVDFLGCEPVPSKSGKNIRRLMQIRVRKYEDYS